MTQKALSRLAAVWDLTSVGLGSVSGAVPPPKPDSQVCYLGHEDCWDNHTSERLADEADWFADRDYELGVPEDSHPNFLRAYLSKPDAP